MTYILKFVLFSNEKKSPGILEIDDWKKRVWKQN